jgi:hypothetical protein
MISYDSEDGALEITCDVCPNSDYFYADNFIDGLGQAKDNGWISENDGNGWLHFCSKSCQAKNEFGG